MERRDAPHNNLDEIKELAKYRRYQVSFTVRSDLAALGWDQEDLRDCLLALDAGDFQQCIEYEDRPGVWHDVYVTKYGGKRVYVKFVRDEDTLFVQSFHKPR